MGPLCRVGFRRQWRIIGPSRDSRIAEAGTNTAKEVAPPVDAVAGTCRLFFGDCRCGGGYPELPIYRQPAIPAADPLAMARGVRAQNLAGTLRRSPGRSVRTPPHGLSAICLQQVRAGLPDRARGAEGGESARRLRDLPLQLGRNARLGLLPDQYRPPEAARVEPPGPAGLQSQYRLCVPALLRAGLPAVVDL